ncbi:cytochrome c oxidase assembly protein COX15-like [Humulus lupulus]|uniref:cytochrome c oxidase assembly protein COX15-like n=1 Tax=Humulus lupulus TaxID=3486 RepID=UPI002B416706|nr:cytochrome c oxidase assembly protein COX15-like [Humulus lupulus]
MPGILRGIDTSCAKKYSDWKYDIKEHLTINGPQNRYGGCTDTQWQKAIDFFRRPEITKRSVVNKENRKKLKELSYGGSQSIPALRYKKEELRAYRDTQQTQATDTETAFFGQVKGAAKVKRLALPVSLLVGITALSGAFVLGNDDGHAYNTFPKMGDTWIPEDVLEMNPLIRNFFENTSMVQLDHRILTTATLVSIASLWWLTRKVDLHPAVRYLIGSTVGMAGLQVTLGISTLLSFVPVSLGSAHQAGALTLMSLMILLIHTLRKPSPSLLKSLPKVAKTI